MAGSCGSPCSHIFMKNGELSYLQALRDILSEGILTDNRTGVRAYTVPHLMIQHDMQLGFPLLTTKKMAFKAIRVELEGFIKGITDKYWFQERGCHIWDEWCNPWRVINILDPIVKKRAALVEPDLGPIYGSQWRAFDSSILPEADQLYSIVKMLKTNPLDRRMVCSAWNPLVLNQQALPPCHVLWHVFVTGGKLHLCWFQRSCDFFLGESFNLASYGLLLHLLAKEAGLEEGQLTGFLSNCHIYENHVDAVKEQLSRKPFDFPKIETKNFTSIFDWTHDQSSVTNYKYHPAIKAEIAI